MAIKAETKIFYTRSDGKVFMREEHASAHESKLNDLVYYEIRYGADTCEGRSCLDKTAYVAVNAKSNHGRFITHAMYKKFGSPVTFVQGVFGSNAIMDYWSIVGKCPAPEQSNVIMRVEDRFAANKLFGEGIWHSIDGKWQKLHD